MTREKRAAGSPRASTTSPLFKRSSRNAAAQASTSSGLRPPNRSVRTRSGTRLCFADMSGRLSDAGERRPDASVAPGVGRRRRRAGIANIRALALLQRHLLPAAADHDTPALHEHAEDAAARTGEEARAAHGDQAERAAHLHRRGRRPRGAIEQHGAGLQRDLAAGVDQVAVDRDAGELAQPYARAPAELEGHTRRLTGADAVGNEHRGFARQRAARQTGFGKALAVDVFDQAGLFGALRAGATRHDQRESRRTEAE